MTAALLSTRPLEPTGAGRHRTQIDTLVEQLSIDLQRREIDEPVAGEHLNDPAPFGIGEFVAGSTADSVQTAGVSAVAALRRRVAVERTSPVNVAACLVDTPCPVSIAKVSVSASCAARRSPLSRTVTPRERVLFP